MEYGEGTAASYGCGATLKGEFWYFGGGFVANYRQVTAAKMRTEISEPCRYGSGVIVFKNPI